MLRTKDGNGGRREEARLKNIWVPSNGFYKYVDDGRGTWKKSDERILNSGLFQRKTEKLDDRGGQNVERENEIK